jgi:hypothetical protein
MACFNSSETKTVASSISSLETKLFSELLPSNNDVYFCTATSPFCWISLKIPFTVSSISAKDCVGRFKISDQCFVLDCLLFSYY